MGHSPCWPGRKRDPKNSVFRGKRTARKQSICLVLRLIFPIKSLCSMKIRFISMDLPDLPPRTRRFRPGNPVPRRPQTTKPLCSGQFCPKGSPRTATEPPSIWGKSLFRSHWKSVTSTRKLKQGPLQSKVMHQRRHRRPSRFPPWDGPPLCLRSLRRLRKVPTGANSFSAAPSTGSRSAASSFRFFSSAASRISVAMWLCRPCLCRATGPTIHRGK